MNFPQRGQPERHVRAFAACSGVSNCTRADSLLLYKILIRETSPAASAENMVKGLGVRLGWTRC
jgi:hypothetical protein